MIIIRNKDHANVQHNYGDIQHEIINTPDKYINMRHILCYLTA